MIKEKMKEKEDNERDREGSKLLLKKGKLAKSKSKSKSSTKVSLKEFVNQVDQLSTDDMPNVLPRRSTRIRGPPKSLSLGDFVGPWQGPSNVNKRGLRDVDSEDSSIECDCDLGTAQFRWTVEMQASPEQSPKQHQTPNAWNTPTRVLTDVEQWPKLTTVSPLVANEMMLSNKFGSLSVDQRKEVMGSKQRESDKPVRACRNEDSVDLHIEDGSEGLDTLAISGKSLQVGSSLIKEEINQLSLFFFGWSSLFSDESRKLLDQTAAAVALPRPLDFSGIEDVSQIVKSSVSGELASISELCAVKRTLRSARELFEKLEELALHDDDSSERRKSIELCVGMCPTLSGVVPSVLVIRYLPLLDILRSCNFLSELEQKIGYCIDCNFSIILDRASEDLEIIRSERKRNTENLDSLLKKVSARIFQGGGIDRPLITKRRSRMCVGIRASHRSLLPDGIVLKISSSGATYFMEPKEAVELNNLEVRLSNSEKVEEQAILSLFTSAIAESNIEIKYLLDRILELDLALARAAHGQWMHGVCPNLTTDGFESYETDSSLLIDIEAIQHPLLLETFLKNSPDLIASKSGSSDPLNRGNGAMKSEAFSDSCDFPVPIDIKVGCSTKVVVISGPNTGGKTASMKTLGLASVMSKAGMYLPAKRQPRLPWFDLILADIGDHQSLEQNLSTFSGHISQLCKMLEVASKESLVLIDEIGSGTDPSEGVALSASILQYLKDRVNLAVVTTHYADLTRLKERDTRFENAAMEFSLETLQPTYQILWGSRGDSNALSIAKSIGFDDKIIERAQVWVDKLMPEKQKTRQSLLYQSLMEEKNRLETQARGAASLGSDIMNLYREIRDEVEDLDRREAVLMANETRKVKRELKAAKSQIESVIQEFESQLRTTSADQFSSLIKKSESAIASIVEAHCPSDDFSVRETADNSYTPQIGEQVHVEGLGNKLATVVQALDDDNTVLVQYGKIRIRVNKSNIKALRNKNAIAAKSSVQNMKRQGQPRKNARNLSEFSNDKEVSYGPVVQTSKNTVDLRENGLVLVFPWTAHPLSRPQRVNKRENWCGGTGNSTKRPGVCSVELSDAVVILLALLQRMYKDARAEISVLRAENKELKRKATVMFRFGGPPYAAVEEQAGGNLLGGRGSTEAAPSRTAQDGGKKKRPAE
ncbi:hypothetical protein TEA_026792 [Camellia sinensis var. sinensis]|uniref:DNA mismatch repair proteins mutS family domain-containing protein n=1 Tax=Camellia sinensis var. sinensis TaxID=542762 RepID=A0A4S4EAU0_CAMSN|nr:hypothetical protein TEA_026792 [Camellia sinensis var. sinensis]